MRFLSNKAEPRVRLGEPVDKWVMRYFFKYLFNIIVKSEYSLIAVFVFREGRKFNTIVRLCELDNLVAMYAIPRILMFFPKKDLTTIYTNDRIKARKKRLQF
jgi:hypothetical protein